MTRGSGERLGSGIRQAAAGACTDRSLSARLILPNFFVFATFDPNIALFYAVVKWFLYYAYYVNQIVTFPQDIGVEKQKFVHIVYYARLHN